MDPLLVQERHAGPSGPLLFLSAWVGGWRCCDRAIIEEFRKGSVPETRKCRVAGQPATLRFVAKATGVAARLTHSPPLEGGGWGGSCQPSFPPPPSVICTWEARWRRLATRQVRDGAAAPTAAQVARPAPRPQPLATEDGRRAGQVNRPACPACSRTIRPTETLPEPPPDGPGLFGDACPRRRRPDPGLFGNSAAGRAGAHPRHRLPRPGAQIPPHHASTT